MTDTIPASAPPLPTCDDDGDHILTFAFGRTYCECNHAAVINFHNVRAAGVKLDEERVPLWWLDALRPVPLAVDFGDLTLGALWTRLCDLAEAIAAGQHTWETWGDFCASWVGMPGAQAERFLDLLKEVGIAEVVISPWNHSDYAGRWHNGAECGCTSVDLILRPNRDNTIAAAAATTGKDAT
ncbi:hypothetical protein [Glycomyces tarimensis]